MSRSTSFSGLSSRESPLTTTTLQCSEVFATTSQTCWASTRSQARRPQEVLSRRLFPVLAPVRALALASRVKAAHVFRALAKEERADRDAGAAAADAAQEAGMTPAGKKDWERSDRRLQIDRL